MVCLFAYIHILSEAKLGNDLLVLFTHTSPETSTKTQKWYRNIKQKYKKLQKGFCDFMIVKYDIIFYNFPILPDLEPGLQLY